MKILFTLFTPPFVQMQSPLFKGSEPIERKYLNYDDWFNRLRRFSAMKDTVKFISFTKAKKVFSIEHDGYESVFFPIANPEEKVRDGRWDFFAPGLVDWVKGFDPDVIHIVGTGHLMALEIMKAGFNDRTCLWERMTLYPYKFDWEEYKLCRCLVMPHAKAAEEASRRMGDKVTSLPLGANVTLFRPDYGAGKAYDVMSVGYTSNKQSHVVKEIVRKNSLSWLLAGGINKGWPFTKLEDALFAGSLRRRLGLDRVKKAKNYPHVCGFFGNDRMPGMYNSAKVFVHPALYEGAPRCVQEALACEVPVVVLKSTVPYVDPSFGVACADHAEFEEAVLSLLKDGKRRKEMGRRGREWLLKNHSPEKLYEAFQALNAKAAKG